MRKIFFITAFILLLPLTAWARILDPGAAQEHARELAVQGKYEEALDELLFSLIEADENERSEVYATRSRIHALKGSVLQALSDMDYAVRSAPDGSCVRVERAMLYYSFGEPGLAEIDAVEALRSGCDNSELALLRARLYLQNGDMLNAIDWFYKLILDDEYRLEALGSTGLAYSILGYPETASAYYREALREDPDNARLHAELADALTLTGGVEPAFHHYERAMELDPKNRITANNYAYTLVLEGRMDEAIDVFNRINNTDPSPYSLCNMLEISLTNENYQRAIVFGNLCIKAFVMEQGMMENERYYVNAIFRAIRTIREDRLAIHPLTQLDLGYQHIKHGERVEALSAFLMALMMDPHNVAATFETGRLYTVFGETSKGAAYLNLAASMVGSRDPIAARVRRLIGREALSLSGNNWFFPESELPKQE